MSLFSFPAAFLSQSVSNRRFSPRIANSFPSPQSGTARSQEKATDIPGVVRNRKFPWEIFFPIPDGVQSGGKIIWLPKPGVTEAP
jgi:hypothetical protein